MTSHSGHGDIAVPLSEWMPAALAIIAIIAYVGAAHGHRTDARPWPPHRTTLWCAGALLAVAPVVAPIARLVHDDLVLHMIAHVISTMLAPILLVLAAPMTLLLRSLAVVPARRVSRLLRSAPIRVLTHPVIAVTIAASGMWLVYTTPLFALMMQQPLVHLLVHGHMVIAGFLVTWVAIGLDPKPHPAPRPLVAAMIIAGMASHAVLAKTLYAVPPPGIEPAEAQAAAVVMHSAGAWVEALVIVVFCAQWYRQRARAQARSRPLEERSRQVRRVDHGHDASAVDRERDHVSGLLGVGNQRGVDGVD